MATLTIRSLPAAVVRSLKRAAKRNKRSMEQEVRHILESVTADRASALEQVQASWSRQSRPTSKTEIDRWLRASRP